MGSLVGDVGVDVGMNVGAIVGLALYAQQTAVEGPKMGQEFVGYGDETTPDGQGVDKQ